MNGFLPLLLFFMMANKNKGGNFNLDSLSPLLKTMGLDTGALSSAFNQNGLGEILKGNLSMEKILPVALNMLNSGGGSFPFKNQDVAQNAQESQIIKGAEENSFTPDYLNPIANIADDEVNFALARYFANN